MPTINGLTLAKIMERLGEEPLSDLHNVEFDDGISAEPFQVRAIERDFLSVRTADGQDKKLTRAKASRGTIVDPDGRLSSTLAVLIGEGFCQRTARLLGDSHLEGTIYKALSSWCREMMPQLDLLPDYAAATLARLVLKQEVPEEEVTRASTIARKLGLQDAIEAAARRMTTTSTMPDMFLGGDSWLKEQTKRVLHYIGPEARFTWPDLLPIGKYRQEFGNSIPGLAKGGYLYGLPEQVRRQRLTYSYLEAPNEDFDGAPAGSCGRLRQIVFALKLLIDLAGDYYAGGKREMVDVWCDDLLWLKEHYYTPRCNQA